MTTDNVKQPPDTDRHRILVFREVIDDGQDEARTVARDMVVAPSGSMAFCGPGERVVARNNEGLRVFRRDDHAVAILDRYDEERAEWERQVKEARAGTDGLRSSGYVLETRVGELKCEIDALRSQVTTLTEERDAAIGALDMRIRENSKTLARAEHEEARADRAEKERDEARASVDEWSGRARQAEQELVDERTAQHEACRMMREVASVLGPQGVHTPFIQQVKNLCDAHLLTTTAGWPLKVRIVIEERDRAIAERDDLGCQLEALRAVQRDDMQVLLGRVAGLEKWRATTEAAVRGGPAYEIEAVVDEKGGA